VVKAQVNEKEAHPPYTYDPEWNKEDWEAAIEEAGERTVARAREEYSRWLEEPLPDPNTTRGSLWWLSLATCVLIAIGGCLWLTGIA